MASNQKALIFIALGALFALVGSIIMISGGFKSIMVDPTDGPLTGDSVRLNAGHYRALVLNYPEMFNCATLNDDVYANAAAGYESYYIKYEDIRDSARAYCRYHDGEQAWTFALYLPLTLLILGLCITALLRKSGYTLSLVGVGLCAVMISFTLVILALYQAHSFVPQTLNAFTDCDGLTAEEKSFTTGFDPAVDATLSTSVYHDSLIGPIPRRGWLCESEWDYDSDFRTASNLVYGGAAVSILAYFFLLIAFAYLVQPMVTPVPAFAKAANFRSADFDSETEYTYTYDDEEY